MKKKTHSQEYDNSEKRISRMTETDMSSPVIQMLNLQRMVGNAAVSRMFAPPSSDNLTNAKGEKSDPLIIQRDSTANMVDTATGTKTSNHNVSVSATLAGGQVIGKNGSKVIHTKTDTNITVSATASGIHISFSPSLTITAEDAMLGFIDVDIDILSFDWRFGDQTLQVDWIAANGVNWFGNPGGELLTAFGGALHSLPSRMFTPGYDPFSDPDLLSDLTSLAGSIASTGGSGSLPRTTHAEIKGGFTIASEVSRDVGDGIKIVIPGGTSFTAIATLKEGIPRDIDSVRLSHVSLHAPGGISVNLQALGTDWPAIHLTSVNVAAGGHVSANYQIIHETLGTALLELLAIAAVRENPLNAGKIREDLTVRDATAHQFIDKLIRTNLEPALRDVVTRNATAIPGLDLIKVLEISGP